MKCSYVFTEETQALGAWQMQRKARFWTGVFVILIVTVILGILCKPWQPEGKKLIFFIGLGGGVISWIFQLLRKTPDRKFRKRIAKHFRQSVSATEIETSLSIADGMLIVENETGLSRKPVDEIYKMVESPDFFFHYISDGFAQMFPKDQLSDEMIETLRSLVKK